MVTHYILTLNLALYDAVLFTELVTLSDVNVLSLKGSTVLSLYITTPHKSIARIML